jgi:hypothetical protein
METLLNQLLQKRQETSHDIPLYLVVLASRRRNERLPRHCRLRNTSSEVFRRIPRVPHSANPSCFLEQCYRSIDRSIRWFRFNPRSDEEVGVVPVIVIDCGSVNHHFCIHVRLSIHRFFFTVHVNWDSIRLAQQRLFPHHTSLLRCKLSHNWL